MFNKWPKAPQELSNSILQKILSIGLRFIAIGSTINDNKVVDNPTGTIKYDFFISQPIFQTH